MTRIHQISSNVLIALIALIISFLVAEIGLRTFLQNFTSEKTFIRYASYEQLLKRYGETGRIYSPHPYLGFYLAPNYRKGTNVHNSLGYRGNEIIVPKPGSEYRIVCIGGSTTYTSQVKDYHKSYPYLLQNYLSEMGYENVTVINAGVPGWSTWESLINFQFRVLDLDPDMIIVYHAVNDVGPRIVWPPEDYRGDNTGARSSKSIYKDGWGTLEKSTLFRFLLIRLGLTSSHGNYSFVAPPASTSYNEVFDRQMWAGEYPSDVFNDTPVTQMLETNKPTFFQRNLENLIAIAKTRQIDVVLSTFAYVALERDDVHSAWDSQEYESALEQHNVILKRIADETGVYLYDFASDFSQ